MTSTFRLPRRYSASKYIIDPTLLKKIKTGKRTRRHDVMLESILFPQRTVNESNKLSAYIYVLTHKHSEKCSGKSLASQEFDLDSRKCGGCYFSLSSALNIDLLTLQVRVT